MYNDSLICQGYLRGDGRKGIRDNLLVIYTVDCAAFVAQKIVSNLKNQGIRAELVGTHICFDNQDMINRLLAFSTHPNIGGVLVVGFGCEYIQASKICDFALASNRPADYFLIQEHGGTLSSITFGVERGKAIFKAMEQAAVPVDFYVHDLFIAMECGGSDFTSGLTANYLLGKVSDCIVSCGGTSVFEEPGEMLGLHDYLRNRAATDKAASEIDELFNKINRYSTESGMFHISPGNFNGGLSSIEEKSIGAVCKSGTSPIEGVIKVTQKPAHSGLWIMDRLQDRNLAVGATVPADAGGLMNMISLGCQICFLTTGRGHVVGTPIAPVIKLTGNLKTYENMKDDIDFDAHELLVSRNCADMLRDKFLKLVFDVCNGLETKADKLGHYEYEMLPSFQSHC